MFNPLTLSADIKQQLKSRKLSLRDAAAQIGTSVSTLSRVCNNHEPDVQTLSRICQWLGVDIGKYFEDIPLPLLPEYPALELEMVFELRGIGMPESEIAGFNRYVQTIIDERDKSYEMLKVNGLTDSIEWEFTPLPPYEA